jgi:hypothetical protein
MAILLDLSTERAGVGSVLQDALAGDRAGLRVTAAGVSRSFCSMDCIASRMEMRAAKPSKRGRCAKGVGASS